MTGAVIYAGSHRKGGNSDRAAELLGQGIAEAGGAAEIMHVRDYEVIPCLACGFCDKPDNTGIDRCVLGRKDQAWKLFAPMFTARTVLFASPIYFYHLPSRFKTWIDRAQQFWRARLDREPWIDGLPTRTAHAVLVAGQPSGDKLFEGSRLTLKYLANNLKYHLADPLSLYGIDQSGDLAARADFEQRIIELGKHAWLDAS